MRVVVYGEGPGDLGIGFISTPTPNRRLDDEKLGALHEFVAKSLVAAGRNLASFQFVAGLQTGLGTSRTYSGSDLLHRKRLTQLLSWVPLSTMPELVVVCVDEDGDEQRLARLDQHTRDTLPARMGQLVVGVARRELESWLVTDVGAVRATLETSFEQLADPEALPSGAAKRALDEVIAKSRRATPRPEIRREIASRADFDLLRRSSRSFDRIATRIRAFVNR